jgi:hypothetical protein
MIEDLENIIIEYEIEQLERFFDKINFLSEPIKLDQCSTITDIPLFIQTHLSISKYQSKNRRYRPYFQRLIQFRNVVILMDEKIELS